MYDCVDIIECTNNMFNPSNHRALKVDFNLDVNKISVSERVCMSKAVSWQRVSDNHIARYQTDVSNKLQWMHNIPRDALLCRDVLCDNQTHRREMSQYCKDLIKICVETGEACLPKVKNKESNIPYWSEVVQPLKDKADMWRFIWQQCGQPRDGTVAQIMRATRHKYHYTVRAIKKNEDSLRKSRMAEAVTKNEGRDFWKEVRKMEGKSKNIPPHIDNVTEPERINNIFTEKYKNLYNSVPSDPDRMTEIHDKIRNDLLHYSGSECIVTVQEIKSAREKLKKDKYDGGAGLWSNHILYAPQSFNVHLSMLATAMTVHGYNAEDLLIGTIVSLPKDQRGNVCDSDNYRGICLCSCINKLLEWIMIHRCGNILTTSGLQFSFKNKHSTTMCTLTLKEIVNYYWNGQSKVYACFMDASKAFD